MSTKVIIIHNTYGWAQENEDKSSWNGDLCQITQKGGLTQTNKCGEWFIQNVQFAHQNIRGLGSFRKLLHKVGVHLKSTKSNESINLRVQMCSSVGA